jgi:hypothetical protein
MRYPRSDLVLFNSSAMRPHDPFVAEVIDGDVSLFLVRAIMWDRPSVEFCSLIST